MSRRAILLGTVAAALASPALAADPYYPQAPAGSPLYSPTSVVMGHVDIFGGLISGTVNSSSGSGGVIGATARANIPLHDWWNLELEVDGIGSTASNNATFTHTDLSGYAHLWKRVGGWNLGGYVGATRQASEPRFIYQLGFEVGTTVYNDLYVGANAGLGVVNDGSAGSGSMVQVGVNGRYELTPNAMLRGDLMYTNVTGVPAAYSVVTAALLGQYRFDNSPWSIFTELRCDTYSGAASGSTYQAKIGATLHFDPPGSTLDTQWENIPWRTPRFAYRM